MAQRYLPKKADGQTLTPMAESVAHTFRHEQQIASINYLRRPGPISPALTEEYGQYYPLQNVVGVGVGERIKGRRLTGQTALKLYVEQKAGQDVVPSEHLLPRRIGRLPVDVEEVGVIRLLAEEPIPTDLNPHTEIRPASAGCSIGYFLPAVAGRNAGTFGALVEDVEGMYILTCNHVLNRNLWGDPRQADFGEEVLQPGTLDMGDPATNGIGKFANYIPFSSNNYNFADAALAQVNDRGLVTNSILGIGPPRGTTLAKANSMVVHKFGMKTRYTVGWVSAVGQKFTFPVGSQNITFIDQIVISGLDGNFSDDGDSGSLVLERDTNLAVGLLFASSGSISLANPIDTILKAFKVSLV